MAPGTSRRCRAASRERRLRPDQLDTHEAPLEVDPEVLDAKTRPRRRGREDHGDVAADVDAVGPLENQSSQASSSRGRPASAPRCAPARK